MSKLKTLAEYSDDSIIKVECPITDEEIKSRAINYPLLSPVKFAKLYKDLVFRPVKITLNDIDYLIQVNYCDNPSCQWFGEVQERFIKAPNKPYKYKLGGTETSKYIHCNTPIINVRDGIVINKHSVCYSNWGLAEEIKRLKIINTVKDIEPIYQFHYDNCLNNISTPYTIPKNFYHKGRSTSKSDKWQCKKCKKNTNTLPSREISTNYHQQRNEVLPLFFKMLIRKVPVKRTCEILEINPTTYYGKLEWFYKRCLEFLERHETKPLKTKTFDRMWINTDNMVYYLNNIRKKGKGGDDYEDVEEQIFKTHITISGDTHSQYIFRADINYNFNVNIEDIEEDTLKYKEDHLCEYQSKNGAYRFPYCPQPPTLYDNETYQEYEASLHVFERRKKYIEGVHLNSTYTTMAHYWLLKQSLKVIKWRFVTDEDNSIITSLYRIFANEIKYNEAHHFLCKVERNRRRKDAYRDYCASRKDLTLWKQRNGYENLTLSHLASLMLTEQLSTHSFYNYTESNNKQYPVWAKNPIHHPLPHVDEGVRMVDCTTNLTNYDNNHISNLLMNVDSRCTNAFIQQIRRSLSILERPLSTARGTEKSYIYANINPKYAQFAVTTLRTYYNFCQEIKTLNGEHETPAQRLGIANKIYNVYDILYFK